MLMGHSDFITVQISNENTQVQIHQPKLTGDIVISSAHSRFLTQKGWKGSRKNIPAAYLTGYSEGKKHLEKGQVQLLCIAVQENTLNVWPLH